MYRTDDTAPSRIANPHTREAWAEWAFVLPFAGRVFALQTMHPIVSAGLMDHSSFFEDPWGRGRDTIAYGLKLIFSDDPAAVAAEVRELHRPIHGRDQSGARYHAWNPKPWAWVHLSTFEATLYARRAIGRATSGTDRETFYREWKEVGRSFGLRDEDMPDDVPALLAYVRHTVEHELTVTPAASRLYRQTVRRLPAPPGPPGTDILWPVASPVAGRTAMLLLAGAFPPVLRRRMKIAWTPLHEAHYQAALLALRAANSTLPGRLRMFAAARA